MLVLKVITNNRYIYENSNHEQMWPFECCTGGRHKLIVSTAEGSQSTQLAAQIIPEIENNRFKFLKQTVQNSKIANIEILDIKMMDKIFPAQGAQGAKCHRHHKFGWGHDLNQEFFPTIHWLVSNKSSFEPIILS